MIECPTDCEIQSVICFLNAKNVKLAGINHQIFEVYGENAMNDGMLRKLVRKFNEGRDNVQTSRGVAGWVRSVVIWCARSKQKFVKTDGLPVCRCPCISSRFQKLFSMKL